MRYELFAAAASIAAEFAPDGYGLVYGSHASGRAGPNSDLDLVLIGRRRPDAPQITALIGRVISLHHAFGLDLDCEVDYSTKLLATYSDVDAAVGLWCFDQVDGRLVPEPVVAEPLWLNSAAFGQRLLLNALTSEHVFLGGAVRRYRSDRHRAEESIARLAVSMIDSHSITVPQAVAALHQSITGASGKDFLGYTPTAHLHSVVERGLAALIAAGNLANVPDCPISADNPTPASEVLRRHVPEILGAYRHSGKESQVSPASVAPLLGSVADAVSEAIIRVRPDLAGADPVVRRSDRADFQSNAALPLAKKVGAKPAELAGALLQHLDGSCDVIESATVSGPGFLNLTVSDTAIWSQVTARLANDRLGVPADETEQRVVIDYSAPNVAKEMHVGHLRTTIIGDSLARVLSFLGADVVRANHLGDWGTQFGMLIQYIDEHPETPWHEGDLGDRGTSAVSALDALYKAARAQFDTDPDFADRARRRVVALQSGDEQTVARWKDIVAESEKAFAAIYDRLGVLLTSDDYVGESFYNPMLADTVTELLAKGVAVDSDGAIVVASREVTGPDDAPAVLMVRKSDGGYGYDSTDLATIRYRITTLRADRLLYVTDSRQALHFQLVFEAARRAGWLTGAVHVDHVAYGTVLGPDGRPFKTRAGGTVRLMDLLDDAVAAARAVVAEKNPNLSAADLDAIAEQAGIGAVKYADLSTSRIKDYTFDPARMTAFNGNTGVYLQYAHARVCSILRRAGEAGSISVDPGITPEPAERELALTLDGYGTVIAEVAATLEPHRLAGYLYELARAFTAFYDTCPVLTATEPIRGNRLALAQLTARTLAHGLELLGIAAPERL